MSYGLRIENPSGALVIDSDAIGYRYHSTPSVFSAGFYTSDTHTPYTFRVTTSSASDVPVAFVKPETDRAAKVSYVTLVSGSTWEIGVYGVNVASFSPDMRDAALAAPTIYVFSQMTASSDAYGMRLYSSSGSVTFDTGFKPLWVRGVLSFSAASGGYNPSSGWSNAASFNYTSTSFSGYTTLAVLGNPNGYASVDDIALSGEQGDYWEYGWGLKSGQLARHRFWTGSYKPSHTLDFGTDTISFGYLSTTAVCIEASGL